MTDPDGLIAATERRWVAEDLQHGAVALVGSGRLPYPPLPVRHSHGFGVPRWCLPSDPEHCHRPAWWTPAQHAARLKRAGVHLPLLAPSASWMESAPRDLTGRVCRVAPLGDLRRFAMEDGQVYWVKPAQLKDDRLPAQRTRLRDFVLAAERRGAPPGMQVQYSFGHLEVEREDRFFVLGTEVLAGSGYVRQVGAERRVFSYDDPPGFWAASPEAQRFASYAALRVAGTVPPSYVMDIATLVLPSSSPHRHVVMELNPVWSSGTYGSDMAGVLTALLAGVSYGPCPAHLWEPDPWLVARAERQSALRPE